MKTLNIFLDLDIRKCGYAIFKNSKYITSGKLTSDKKIVDLEKKTAQTKANRPEHLTKIGKENLPVGEYRLDPKSNKWIYFAFKKQSVSFPNDIERAEFATSKLIDIVLDLRLERIDELKLFIEDSNSNHRKSQYIGMFKTYLYERMSYKYIENLAKERREVILSDIADINVKTIKKEMKDIFSKLINLRKIEVSITDALKNDNKFISKKIVEAVLGKVVSDDEADAINMIVKIDKDWWLKNEKN